MLRDMIHRVLAFFNALTIRHLTWLFRLTTLRPLPVLCLFFIALLLSVASISLVRFETDIFQLFPSRQPALRLLLDSLEWTGGARDAYFLLEGDKQALPAEAKKFADRLQQASIDGKPAFSKITWQIYDEEQAAAFTRLISYAVVHPRLFVSPDAAEKYASRFDDAGIASSLQRLQADLAGQFGSVAHGLASADPLYLRDLILPRFTSASQSLDLDPDSPYFVSRNGKVLIMIAEPSRPVQDMAFARKLVPVINQARSSSAVSISCAGAHISAVLDEAAMKRNILISMASSLVVVLGVFYAAYRRLLPTLLIPLILSSGVVFALAVAGLFLPSIHIISFAFTALITGIGTDYSVHIYDRFHTERAAGKETSEALRLAMLDTGHGVFTAAITTGIPFLALMVSDVRALYELGLLVGLGVIFSLYATFVFLPPLLIFMERRYPISYRPIPGLGLASVWRMTHRWPRAITALSLLLTAGLCWAAFQVHFDGDLKNLQPRHSEAFLAQEKLERNLSIAPKQLLVAIEGNGLQDVLERVSKLDALAGGLVSRGEIAAWSSIGRVINSRPDQEKVSRLLHERLAEGTRVKAVRRQLDLQGFAPEPFQPFLAGVVSAIQSAPPAVEEAIDQLAASPLKGVVERHLIKDDQGYHALVYLHYDKTGFNVDSFRNALKTIDPAARMTGIDLVSDQLREAVRTSFTGAFLLGGVIVLLLMMVHFVNLPSGIFYSLLPVAAAAGCMLGTMAICGMGLNFMNAMVLVTIVGMGSDFGLYIRFRVTAETPQERAGQYVQIGRSVLLSAITTIAGFGSLALTDYGAMSSIGWATNLGIGYITFFTLISLPAFMELWRSRNR